MTFNTNVPNAGQSPGLFPPQNNTNFDRLKIIIGNDHQFNDTSPLPTLDTDGRHKQVTLISRADPTGFLPAGTNGIIYSKLGTSGSSAPWWYNGGYYPLTTVIAMVNFDGTGGNGAKTMRSTFGVDSVVRTNTGAYTINFLPNLPNDLYIIQVTGMSNTLGEVVTGCVKGDPTYSNEVKVNALEVRFAAGSTFVDVRMGSVLITGVPV